MSNDSVSNVLRTFCFCPKVGFLIENPCHELDEYFLPWMKLVRSLDNIRGDSERSIEEEVRKVKQDEL